MHEYLSSSGTRNPLACINRLFACRLAGSCTRNVSASRGSPQLSFATRSDHTGSAGIRSSTCRSPTPIFLCNRLTGSAAVCWNDMLTYYSAATTDV